MCELIIDHRCERIYLIEYINNNTYRDIRHYTLSIHINVYYRIIQNRVAEKCHNKSHDHIALVNHY